MEARNIEQVEDITNISPQEEKKVWKVIFASSAGTMIEWYDFYIFGALATIIAGHYFPSDNPTAAYLETLATFAVGFVVRPFGALVFGRLGDIVGRKYTFLLTLLLMGGSTFAVGLLPGYADIGIAAPILLVFLRMIQGLALGGEYGGATTYVAEHSPKDRRGYFTSFIQTTATLGLFVSLGVILLTKISMDDASFKAWGWRIPFFFSILLVFLSFKIRTTLEESPTFSRLKAEGKLSKNPLRDSFMKKENLKMVLITLFGATAGQGVVWYTGQFYALSFLQKVLNVEFVQSNIVVAIALLIATPFFIVFGSLSDKIGRKKIMLTGMFLAALAYYPIYKAMYFVAQNYSYQLSTGQPTIELTIQGSALMSGLIFIQVFFVTMAYGPIAAFLVELFPTHIRYTSMSLPYHVGNGVFGGLTPFIATAVVATTGNPFAGLIYPIVIALSTVLVGAIFIKERYQSELDDI